MSSRRLYLTLIIIAVIGFTVGVLSVTIINNASNKCPECNRRLARAESHWDKCPNGHAYYSCNPEEVRKHEVCHVSRSNWDYDK